MGISPGFPHGRPLMRIDLEAMPDDGHRYELVDGVLLMSPSPRPIHQRVVARMLQLLTADCPAELEALPAPVDVVLTDDSVLIPDVVVGRRTDFTERGLFGVPVLSVEVLSRSTRLVDLELKRARLQTAGCPNYWLIDPDGPTIRCLGLRAGRYTELAVAAGDELVDVDQPYPVRFRVGDLTSSHPSAYR